MTDSLARNLHLVIPMSGMGTRFSKAGIDTPKPLLEILGRPVLEHILGRFPGVGRCTFICNSLHASTTPLVAEARRLRPDATIRIIEPHRLGPVHAVQQVYDLIRNDEPVVVNYCDFDWEWDFQEFLVQMATGGWDGAVVGYHGFHPHLAGNDLYATMRVQDGRVLEIREKHAFSQDRFREHTSSGTYYFSTGALLKRAFDELVARDLSFNGEFYASTPFQLLIEQGCRIAFHPTTRFCQWGTPNDLAEYLRWAELFRLRTHDTPQSPTFPNTLLLMAGQGQRFQALGYSQPKPMIPVAGTTMAEEALASIPPADRLVLAYQGNMFDPYPEAARRLQSMAGSVSHLILHAPTAGQAITARLALEQIPESQEALVLSCDAALYFDAAEFRNYLRTHTPDAVVFSAPAHQSAALKPHLYGWVLANEGRVTGISTKVPVSPTPQHDFLVTGSFYFRTAALAKAWIDRLVALDRRTNSEFYLDDVMDLMANQGAAVHHYPVSGFLCWGTPVELETFRYWQAHFHVHPHHPYDMTLHERLGL